MHHHSNQALSSIITNWWKPLPQHSIQLMHGPGPSIVTNWLHSPGPNTSILTNWLHSPGPHTSILSNWLQGPGPHTSIVTNWLQGWGFSPRIVYNGFPDLGPRPSISVNTYSITKSTRSLLCHNFLNNLQTSSILLSFNSCEKQNFVCNIILTTWLPCGVYGTPDITRETITGPTHSLTNDGGWIHEPTKTSHLFNIYVHRLPSIYNKKKL